MKKMIKSEIYHDGEYYCGRCLDFDVFTQGRSLDEVVQNLKEAIQLHFEDDKEYQEDFIPTPSLFTMMDLGEIHA
ncbi:toxin-antitoxin system, antitoxin component, HicB family [delta proteobacterium NaphS2]|nr:toxin-antitoxin system, antitoxin component, HicB family [delta proteobacterium NaphS2]